MKERKKYNWSRPIGLFLGLIILILICDFYYLRLKQSHNPSSENNVTTSTDTNSSITADNSSNFDLKENNDSSAPSSNSASDSGNAQSGQTNQSSQNTSGETNPSVYYNTGLSDISSKNYQSAIDNFDKAIAIDQYVPNYYIKKAEAQVALGDKSGAIKTVNTGLAANPNDPDLENKLSILETVVK